MTRRSSKAALTNGGSHNFHFIIDHDLCNSNRRHRDDANRPKSPDAIVPAQTPFLFASLFAFWGTDGDGPNRCVEARLER